MSRYVICMFGSGGVGKSCLTMQFIQGVFMTKYDPTIEDVYTTTLEVDEKNYSLEIYDTAGSDEFSAMRDAYIREGDGFVLVYSITSQSTFNDLNRYFERIMDFKDNRAKGPPAIILVGNKSDLADERSITRETGQALAKKWNCTFLETSAKDRANVTELFYDIVRQINRLQQVSPPKNTSASRDAVQEAEVHIHTNKLESKSSVQSTKEESCCCVLL